MRSDLAYICKEAYHRFGGLNEAKQKELLASFASVIQNTIIDPPSDNFLFTTLFAITASSNSFNELRYMWNNVAVWRHQQAMFSNFAMGFLCLNGEQLWLDTVCQIYGWIESDLLADLLFALLTPKNITSRTELLLSSECLNILEKVKPPSKRSKKRLYGPDAINNAQIAFVLLCLTKTSDRSHLLLFHAILFAFDESDPFIHSLAEEYLGIDANVFFDEYLTKLKHRIEEDSNLEAQVVKYSFEYGCRCNLKSACTVAWKLFSEFASGVCTEFQILPGVLDLLRNMGKSLRSLEKGQIVLDACLEAVFQIVAASEEHDSLLKDLITVLLNSPMESLYLRGYSLLLLSRLEVDEIDPMLLLRGLFVLEEVESKCKAVQFYYWMKQLLLMSETEHLKSREDIDSTLITLYNRTSLRSQFWPKLVQLASSLEETGSFKKSYLVNFVEAWCLKGKCSVALVNLCQAAATYLPKDTLLSLIDRLVDCEAPNDLIDSCAKQLIDEFGSRQEESLALETSNLFLISLTDFDIFQEALTSVLQ